MNSENINNQSNSSSNEISLKELILKMNEWWRYLLSNWLVLLSLSLLGGVLGFCYVYTKKPIYTATTTFVLEDEKAGGGGLGSLAGLASMAGVDLGGAGGGIFQGDNILGLYKSRTILEQTLLTQVENKGKKQLLVDLYIDFKQLKKKWEDQHELIDIKFTNVDLKNRQIIKPSRLRDSILGVIVTDLNMNCLFVTKPDKKLSVIQVDVKAENEFFAKSFNDELVKNVNEFYINTKTKKTLQNVRILQRKVDSVRSVMNGAIFTAVAVSDATPNLNPTRQIQRVAPAQQAQFSAETNKSILAEMVKNLELTKMTLLKETPLIQVVDQPIYPLKKNKVGYVKGISIGVIFLSVISVLFFSAKRIIRNALL